MTQTRYTLCAHCITCWEWLPVSQGPTQSKKKYLNASLKQIFKGISNKLAKILSCFFQQSGKIFWKSLVHLQKVCNDLNYIHIQKISNIYLVRPSGLFFMNLCFGPLFFTVLQSSGHLIMFMDHVPHHYVITTTQNKMRSRIQANAIKLVSSTVSVWTSG